MAQTTVARTSIGMDDRNRGGQMNQTAHIQTTQGTPMPSDESERLAALQALAILDTKPEQAFDRLTRIAAKVFDAPIALVSLVDRDRQWFKSRHGLDATETPRQWAFCAHAILCDRPMVVPDAATDPRFSDSPLVTGAPHIRFYAGAPLRTEDGHVLGTLCVIDTKARSDFDVRATDILTDLADQAAREIRYREDRRRSAEIADALRVSDERFQLAVQGASVGIWDWIHVDGTAETWSDRFYELLGYAPGEINADVATFADLLHPDDKSATFDLVEAHFRGEAKFETEYRLRHKSGVYRWFLGSAQVSRDDNGKPVRMVGTIMDIHDRKMAEAKLRHLLRMTPDFVTSALPDTTLTFANLPYADFLDTTPEALVGRPFLDFVPEADRADVRDALAALTPDNPSMSNEQRRVMPDGAVRWYLWTNLVVFAHEQPTEIISVGRDITVQIEAQQTIADQAEVLRQTNKELEQFAHIASHDLRAPLRAISHLATWIAEDLADSMTEESASNMALLRGRVTRMDAMLDGLLQFSLVGRQGVRPNAVDMAQIAQEEFEFVSGPRPFTLESHALPRLVTGEVPLRLVLRNLFSNAIKHHDRDGGAIVIRASDTGDRYRIAVADDGPGIPIASHDRIFGMFQCLKPRDEVEGSGLGLALIAKQVQALGGVVRVESNPDAERGATFVFDWPKTWPDRFLSGDGDTGHHSADRPTRPDPPRIDHADSG